MTNEVAKTSADYDAMSQAWALPRTLMGGTRAMRDARTLYLPQEPKESDAAYNNRLARSTLFNAFKRTIRGITGKVFSKPILLDDDVPENLVEWSKDIDLTGRNLNSFASDVFSDGNQVGLSHILVEMPVPKDGEAPPKTKADEAAMGWRPYFVHIKAEDLIGWKSETIGGKQVLTQIRYRERATVNDGDYGEKIEERIRILWRDRFEIWKKNENPTGKDDEWVLDSDGINTLGEIPLATYYAARTGFMTAEPPLEDLAHLNEAHWQSSSDQRNILHIARVPILFGAGLGQDKDGNPITVGPNMMVNADDPNAKLGYTETTGAGIEAGRQDLADIEDRMRVLGLELFMQKTGTQTATGKAIDSAEQNSVVKAMALSLEDALELAFDYMAKWAKLDQGGSLTVNVDFGVSMQGAQELTMLLNARLAGEISRETFWAELKRRGLLTDDFDSEAEIERLTAEGPGLGTIGLEDERLAA